MEVKKKWSKRLYRVVAVRREGLVVVIELEGGYQIRKPCLTESVADLVEYLENAKRFTKEMGVEITIRGKRVLEEPMRTNEFEVMWGEWRWMEEVVYALSRTHLKTQGHLEPEKPFLSQEAFLKGRVEND